MEKIQSVIYYYSNKEQTREWGWGWVGGKGGRKDIIDDGAVERCY